MNAEKMKNIYNMSKEIIETYNSKNLTEEEKNFAIDYTLKNNKSNIKSWYIRHFELLMIAAGNVLFLLYSPILSLFIFTLTVIWRIPQTVRDEWNENPIDY